MYRRTCVYTTRRNFSNVLHIEDEELGDSELEFDDFLWMSE